MVHGATNQRKVTLEIVVYQFFCSHHRRVRRTHPRTVTAPVAPRSRPPAAAAAAAAAAADGVRGGVEARGAVGGDPHDRRPARVQAVPTAEVRTIICCSTAVRPSSSGAEKKRKEKTGKKNDKITIPGISEFHSCQGFVSLKGRSSRNRSIPRSLP